MQRTKLRVRQRRLLTIRQAMEMFDVSRQTIHKWRKEKEMPYILYNEGEDHSFVRFDYDDVIEWARTHEVRIVRVAVV